MRNLNEIESGSLPERMRAAVSFAWSIFAKKVGGKLIVINKEASMQLQFAYILQQILPLITFHQDEKLTLELETDANLGMSRCEIDVLLTGIHESRTHPYRIAVELKCYKTIASSGGKRGATDIFMKDVFEDLMVLEQYINFNRAELGIALVMTDMERFVKPTNRGANKREAKCWDYDISTGRHFGPVHLVTPIGGKPIDIRLEKKYAIEWIQHGSFWFLELEGAAQPQTADLPNLELNTPAVG